MPLFRVYRYQPKAPGDQSLGDLIFAGYGQANLQDVPPDPRYTDEANASRVMGATKEAALKELVRREGPLAPGMYFVIREEETQWPAFAVGEGHQPVGNEKTRDEVEVPPRESART